MSVIEAATAGFKDLADGTVRFFFDVEPRHAGAALELFRVRGTPAALAALKTGFAAVPDAKPEPKGGMLSKEASILCARADFQHWMKHNLNLFVTGANHAAIEIRRICEVESRVEFDSDPAAGERFIQRIRLPFMRAMRATA